MSAKEANYVNTVNRSCCAPFFDTVSNDDVTQIRKSNFVDFYSEDNKTLFFYKQSAKNALFVQFIEIRNKWQSFDVLYRK